MCGIFGYFGEAKAAPILLQEHGRRSYQMGFINKKKLYNIMKIDILNTIEKERYYCIITDKFRRYLISRLDKSKILKKVNISRQTLERILYKKNYWINIKTLFILCRIAGVQEQLIKKDITTIKTKNSLPIQKLEIETSEEICRVIGHLLSDGGIHIIEKSGKYRAFYVNNEKELLKCFMKDIKTIFGDIEIYFRKREIRGDEIWLSTTIGLLLYKILECKLDRIPEFIFKMNERCISSCLQAIYDDEGYLYPNKHMIVLSFVNKELLSDAKRLLELIGIKGNPIHVHQSKNRSKISKNRSKMFYFNITGRKNILNFYKKINFIHPVKREKLKLLISKYGV